MATLGCRRMWRRWGRDWVWCTGAHVSFPAKSFVRKLNGLLIPLPPPKKTKKLGDKGQARNLLLCLCQVWGYVGLDDDDGRG